MNLNIAKINMLKQQIQIYGINNSLIIDTIMKVPREIFLPKDKMYFAYSELDIKYNNHIIINAPIIARILNSININNISNILEIGCNSGYLIAVLSQIFSKIDTIHCNMILLNKIKNILCKLYYNNVYFYNKILDHKKYDCIIYSKTIDKYPYKLLNYLNNHGQMIYILKKQYFSTVVLLNKYKNYVTTKNLFDIYINNYE